MGNGDRGAVKIPTHIAIIMDGNGRWAKKRHLPRILGHRKGVERVREIVRVSGEIGLPYLTLYTFSSENWQRPRKEVSDLMKMLERLVRDEESELAKNNVRLKAIGRLSDLPPGVRDKLSLSIDHLSQNTGLTLTLALSYGGRAEILDGVKKALVATDNLTEQEFAGFLYDPDLPEPDLLIRTGGERRISNFLLWQIAYTELYFTEALWPDFGKKELLAAIDDFGARERRFGRVKE